VEALISKKALSSRKDALSALRARKSITQLCVLIYSLMIRPLS
jgi:hypothetical protein